MRRPRRASARPPSDPARAGPRGRCAGRRRPRARRARVGARAAAPACPSGRRRRARWSPRAPGPATQPEPSTPSPHALPRIFTTESAAATTPAARAIPAVGAGTRASGPSMRGNGSSRASASISPLDGGSDRVEVLQDRRALDLAPRLAAVGERQRAEHPRDPEPDARGQHGAQRTVDGGRRRRSHPPAQSRAHPLEAEREDHPGDQRPDQAERGRPGRAAAVVEQQRADARARRRRRPRTRPARARPRRSPAPSRTAPAAGRRPRSASRCPSRHPSVPAATYNPVPLTSSTPRPRRRATARDRRPPPLRPARGGGAGRARRRAS